MRFTGWVTGNFYIRKRRPFPYGIRRRFLLTSGRMLLEVSIFRPHSSGKPDENTLRFLQVRFALQAILPWKDSLIVSEIL